MKLSELLSSLQVSRRKEGIGVVEKLLLIGMIVGMLLATVIIFVTILAR